MKTIQLGGYEAEVDNTDVSFLKKYEKAAAFYAQQMAEMPQDGCASQLMNQIYGIFEKTFEQIFGKGVCKEMFGGKKSVDECVEVYKTLIEAVNDFSCTTDKIHSLAQ